MTETTIWFLIFLTAALSGAGLRTLYGYLDKFVKGEVLAFGPQFVASAIMSIIIVFVAASGIALATPIPDSGTDKTVAFFGTMIGAFLTNAAINTKIPSENPAKPSS